MSAAGADGPAYSRPAKALATLLMAALVVTAVRNAGLLDTAAWPAAAKASLGVIIAAVAVCYYWILVSRTSVDATHIAQTWLWPKRVALADVVQAKFIYLPGLAWLIAPRLVVRARGRNAATVFPAAAPAVLREFARLSLGPTLR